jgi:hypothetical protein
MDWAIPPGHTAFSWFGGAFDRPAGHTGFSWVGSAEGGRPVGADLAGRVATIEAQAANVRSNCTDLPDGATRVQAALLRQRAFGCVLWQTPGDYYDWPLAKRA